jgi:hypothetical protein
MTALDIGQTLFTDEIAQALIALLFGNRVITSLICGNTGLSNPGLLTRFLTELLARGVGLTVTIPRSDIDAMYRATSLTLDSHRELVDLMAKVNAGDPKVVIPQETIRFPDEEVVRPINEDQEIEPLDDNCELQRPPMEFDPDEFTPTGSLIPPPDNDALRREFAETYSILALVTRIKMDKEGK